MQEVYHQIARELNDSRTPEQDQLRLKVTSKSMAPLLRPGDYVLVNAVPIESIYRGDILVTRREDGYLTHRLVAVDAQGWLTKGDRNRKADAPVGAQEIVGLVVAHERRGKLHDLSTPRQRIMARLYGWLGGQEIACHSPLVTWSARILLRSLLLLAR